MALHFFIAGSALAGLFIALLVLSRTMASIVNLLNQLQYVVRKDVEFVKESIALRQAMQEEEERNRSKTEEASEENPTATPSAKPAASAAMPAPARPRAQPPNEGRGKKIA